jgi:Flp pilus assembly protein TadG
MTSDRTRPAPGQVLVVFALSLLVIVGVSGLSIDAGGAFAQRRDQQAAADLAALAAANDYLINGNDLWAIDRARTVTRQNGYEHGVGGTSVDVAIDTSNGVEVTVGISAQHGNTFLRVLGMPSWTVSTEAASLAGFPDGAVGAGPFIFNIGAFEDDGTPKYQTDTNFGETNGDIPTSELDFAWTNYGTGNVNTTEVADIISGGLEIERTMDFGQYIGQENSGNHTALFQDVDTYLSGLELPVAVVDNAGNFMGWAMFHVTSASASSDKHVQGYFLSSFVSARLKVTSCAANDCPRYLGAYVLKLSD